MSDVLHHVQATHTRHVPVFVIGYPRSGTSLTCRLLRRYLKVSFGTESQFIIRYKRRLGGYGDLRDDAQVRRLIADIATERFFERSRRNWGFVLDQDRAFAALRGRTYADVLHAIFGQLAVHNGMARWGDKTPQYNGDLGTLLELFPDAQFLHIVRDGRDVALSIRQTTFGPKNAAECAEDWRNAVLAIDAFASRLAPGQFLQVRYEDLIGDAAGTLRRVGGWLGIDDRDGALANVINTQVAHELLGNNTDKWRRCMHPRELQRFEGVAGPVLTQQGYDLALRGHARRLTVSELMFWRARGALTRLSLGGYWNDTLYKARLRAGTAVRHFTSPR